MYCGGASVALPPYFATMVDYVPPRQHNTISAWTNGMGQVRSAEAVAVL